MDSIVYPSTNADIKKCSICQGIFIGQGLLCFPSNCNATSKFENHVCPSGQSKCNCLPIQSCPHKPNAIHLPRQNRPGQPYNPTILPSKYYLNGSTSPTQVPKPPSTVTPRALPESPSFPASLSASEFTVLVNLKAPTLLDNANDRADIDLALVLDVSGSMKKKNKLDDLKSSVGFIIDRLGPSDRLAMVTFSEKATTIFTLQKMDNRSLKDAATSAVESLKADGSTDIVKGLTEGVGALEQGQEPYRLSCIIFLSDGKDEKNDKTPIPSGFGEVPVYLTKLPKSIYPHGENQQPTKIIPVHCVGLGSDHDSAAMHAIANKSGGTYCFLESASIIQGAFARHFGALVSVVVLDLEITVTSASPGVKIKSIKNGSYSKKDIQGKEVLIKVGNLYADEKKDFLVLLEVPAQNTTGGGGGEITALLDIAGSYRNVLTKKTVILKFDRVEIHRPEAQTLPVDATINLEVDRQKNRVLVAEGLEKAIGIAEAKNSSMSMAADLLENILSHVRSSKSGKIEDPYSNFLAADLEEIIPKMKTKDEYENTGRPLLLESFSSHSGQKVRTSDSGRSFYSTPAIDRLIFELKNIDINSANTTK